VAKETIRVIRPKPHKKQKRHREHAKGNVITVP
jgi:hypothetical protein